jgi:hypothetical protein
MKFTLPPAEFTFASFSFPRWVGTLPSGSFAKRIERMRKPACGPYYHAPKPNSSGRGFYLDSDGMPGLRYELTGDSFGFNECGDSIEGLVFRLPKGRGFLAGWTMGVHMASDVSGEIYADESDARRAARDEAESMAERQAEHEAELNEGEEQ